MNRQSAWLTSVTSGLISKPEVGLTSDPIIRRWLDGVAERLGEAYRTKDPSVIRAASDAFWELQRAVRDMQQREREA